MYQETVVEQTYQTRTSVGAAWKTPVVNRYTSFVDMMSISHMPINTNGDDGGPWYLHRKVDQPSLAFFNGNSPDNLTFHGETVVVKPNAWLWSETTPSAKSDTDLDSFGTTAMARSAPTNPAFDLSTSLGELVTEGIPKSIGNSYIITNDMKYQVKQARNAGSEYLNMEFAWLPLMRDLQEFARTVKESDRILNQYRRDSDTKIRRGYVGKPEDSTYLRMGSMQGSPASEFSGPGGMSETYRRRQWFKGAFRYHIPVADDTLGKFRNWVSMSNHLLGWKVTPETVWNIAPWSWAADWFANTGDIMANISNLGTDGLVMQYGYSMAHSVKEVHLHATFSKRYGQKALMSRYMREEYKQRRPATPYGFGIDLHTLSAKQIAIMAALGLSKT